jgi:tetratricopeptide (TPR) repeat protein/predicted Ser/Thr protein kinase
MAEGGSPTAGSGTKRSPDGDWAGLIIANYRVEKLLGRGGMGQVLLAEDLRLKRKVAIKVLPPEYSQHADRLRRFSQEARAASALNHPHIVSVYDVGEADIGRYIVMEYVQGRTLRELCAEGMGVERSIECSSQIGRALGAAHAAGIVHRDIKPDNVMVRDDGYAKILDFGLALQSPLGDAANLEGNESGPLTQPGQVLGTIKYMSPEQARGQSATSASDIFSLGIVLYEMVTRVHPFQAQTAVSMLHAIITQDPIAPTRLAPSLQRWLESLILRMLAKDPTSRPTAVALVEELEMAGGRGPVELRTTPTSARPFVGRDMERAALQDALHATDREGGRLLCLVGEAGIGKTTLVDEFLFELEQKSTRWFIGRGRCSERLSGAEAYLPFLQALESLLRQDREGLAGRILKLLSPTWYQHATSLSNIAADERGASRESMKREMDAFLRELTAQRPLILFFDDLHWADASTLDMLTHVAGQFQGIRVLVIVTYRPTEMVLAGSPFLSLKLDLTAKSLCRGFDIEYLTIADIERYISLVCPAHAFPQEFVRLVHARTSGNALFMADLLLYLKDREIIQQKEGIWVLTKALREVERDLPESVRSIVQRKIDQLQDMDRTVLIAASVQGNDFDSASVAHVLAMDPADLEDQLDRLERIQVLVRLVEETELPNRTPTLRYRFVHLLYQNALYASLRPTRRAQMSLAMAETLVGSYRERCAEIASNLAFLFETGRDFERAADYSILGAQNALQVFANREAAVLAHHALELLKSLPPSADLIQKEIAAQMTSGVALATLRGGYSAPEVEAAYGRALQLCESADDKTGMFPALYGLWSVYTMRADYRRALDLGKRMLPLASDAKDAMLLSMSHNALGFLKPFIGDFAGARTDLEEVIRLHNPQIEAKSFARFGVEPKTGSLAVAAFTYWALGFPDKGRQCMREALEMTERVKHSITVSAVMTWNAGLALDLEDYGEARKRAEEAKAPAMKHGLVQGIGWSQFLYGAALGGLGDFEIGVREIRAAIQLMDSIGCALARSSMLLAIAEVLSAAGKLPEAREVLAEARAFRDRTDELYRAPEFDRIEGNLFLLELMQDERSPQSPEAARLMESAEQCYQRSIEVARSHEARSYELKSSVGLAWLRQSQGRISEARAALEPIVGWFSEGLDTPLFLKARALLDSL